MIDYMDAMFDNFSIKFKPDDTSPNPESEDLFVYGTTADLDTQKAAEYHTFFRRYCSLTSDIVQILDPQSPLCSHA